MNSWLLTGLGNPSHLKPITFINKPTMAYIKSILIMAALPIPMPQSGTTTWIGRTFPILFLRPMARKKPGSYIIRYLPLM